MKIVVAGGSGFVGEPLVRRLVARGDDVAVLSRNPSRVEAGRGVEWDGVRQGAWADEVANADAIVNLAGENIAGGRWTDARRKALVASRLDATNAIVEALRRAPSRRRVLVNASAVGYYGDRADETLDESAARGSGFLAELVEKWEAAARLAEPVARVVILRLGVVLAPDGGALAKMLLPFRLGAGGPIASGRQWMSWIAREDILRLIEWAIANDSAAGVYNATAPEPTRNRDFAHALGHALHRPAIVPTPALALRVMFGEMAEETMLVSQRAIPRRAQSEGFTFAEPALDSALAKMFAAR